MIRSISSIDTESNSESGFSSISYKRLGRPTAPVMIGVLITALLSAYSHLASHVETLLVFNNAVLTEDNRVYVVGAI